MINPKRLNDFDTMLGICGPEYLYEISLDEIGNYCLARITNNEAYIHNISVGKGIDKEYFCSANINTTQKKSGWYICKYIEIKDDGYDSLGTHLFVPVIEPVKYIDDDLVCNDKSPLLIFMRICISDFGYTHIESFEGSPYANINLVPLIRSCARLDRNIHGYNLVTLKNIDRYFMMNLFINSHITSGMISTWINPYNIGR